MRYLIIDYYRRPNGQMDEVVSIARRTRMRDIQSAAVILDFETRTVVKCSMDGVVVPKDWQRIRDFYHQHYSQVIDNLEKRHSETGNTD
jgi:hypothetical protein